MFSSFSIRVNQPFNQLTTCSENVITNSFDASYIHIKCHKSVCTLIVHPPLLMFPLAGRHIQICDRQRYSTIISLLLQAAICRR